MTVPCDASVKNFKPADIGRMAQVLVFGVENALRDAVVREYSYPRIGSIHSLTLAPTT